MKLSEVTGPLTYTNTWGWVDVDFEIADELAADAADTALKMKRGTSHLYRDAFKQRHNIGVVYF